MTRPMPDETDERLCDWVDGAMTAREQQRFEAEMRVSKPLRERAEAYRRTVLAVREGLAQDDDRVDVAESVLARIRGGAQEPTQAQPTGPRLPSVPGAWWRSALVAAAMLALIFLLDRLEPRARSLDTARADEPVDPAPSASQAAAEPDAVASKAPGAFVEAPRTMVPQLTLRVANAGPKPVAPQPGAQQGAAESAPRADGVVTDKGKAEELAAAGGVAGNAGRFGGVDVLFGELADSVRAIGPVRLQALAPASEGATQRAWVATGRDADVRAFLANVSAAAAALGYAVENGEARAADVEARTPRAKSEARPGNGGNLDGPELRVVIVLERPAK